MIEIMVLVTIVAVFFYLQDSQVSKVIESSLDDPLDDYPLPNSTANSLNRLTFITIECRDNVCFMSEVKTNKLLATGSSFEELWETASKTYPGVILIEPEKRKLLKDKGV